MRMAVGRYLIIFLLKCAIFGHVQSYDTDSPVCECNAGGFRLISNHLPTGFEGKFAGHFTKITSCEEPCTLNYGLLPCTGYFYEPNNYGKCTLFFYHGVNTNIQSSPDGTASLYVKCDQVSLEECTASLRENIVATTTHSSGVFSVQPTTTTTTKRSGGAANGTTVVGATGVTESGFKEELVMTTDMGEDPILLFLSYNTIYQYDRSANRTLKLLDNLKNAISMDYWLKDSTIIWSIDTGKIYMCNLHKNLQFPKMIACDDNGNHTVLVEHNISYPVDLAVDWIHGLLFWSDKNWNTINVMDLNTKQRKVLFKKKIEIRQDIAVDPSKGLIFWTDDYNNVIERASMDGNDRMTLASSSSIYDMTLDIFNERVYWSDFFTETIASRDYNGNNYRSIVPSDTHIWFFPYSFTIFEEKLYWADSGNAFVMNKFNGTEVRKLISGLYNLRTVRVYHNAAQPELPNKCDQHTCGNGAICLPKSNSFDNEGKPQPRIGLPYSCVCADGYTTGKEPNTCVLII